jgi:hypothetical protein
MGESAAERLTALFAEAIALTPDGRAALLDRLRSSDTTLALADELAAWLAANATADTVLATGVPGPAGEPLATRPGSFATVVDHGARAGTAIAASRLAVALDDGAIVIETLGPHTLDQLTAVVARATTLRAPVGP